MAGLQDVEVTQLPADSTPDGVQPDANAVNAGATETPEGDGANPVVANGSEVVPPVDEAFEFEGVQLKGLTPEQREAIEKGAMRVADYTKKSQEVSTLRRNIGTYMQRMGQDPQLLLKHFPRQYLEYVLNASGSGVKPKSGGGGNGQIDLEKFEPEVANVISSLQEKIGSLEGQLGQFTQKFSTMDEQFVLADLNEEVTDALSKYKDLNTPYDRALVCHEISKDGSISALDAAARVSKFKKESWKQTVTTKAKETTKVVVPGKSTPPAASAAKTFDDGDKLAMARLSR